LDEIGSCTICKDKELLGSSDSVDCSLLIGGHPRCAIRLSGGGIAPFHCLLAWRRKGLCLFDLGSGRGTFLNGRPVRYAQIHGSQTLTIGNQLLEIEMHGDPTDPAKRRNLDHRPVLALTAIHGPHEGESAILPQGGWLLLGRVQNADLQLKKDKGFSREHLKIKVECKDGAMTARVQDLKCRNRTRINKNVVQGVALARPGDVIHYSSSSRSGGTVLLFHYNLEIEAW
jgi:hypothetical protein